MTQSNISLEELQATIQLFCDAERSVARSNPPNPVAAKQLRDTFNQNCPNLAKNFLDVPDVVYARRIINYGISYTRITVTENIWELYYEGGSTLEDLGKALDYGARTVKKYISRFAYNLAVQLLEIENQISNPIPTSQPSRVEIANRKAVAVLQDKYCLSPKQAEVLLAFCLYPNLTQAQICSKVLYIAENTLKTHKRRILSNMSAKKMPEAVLEASRTLKTALPNEWKILQDNNQTV